VALTSPAFLRLAAHPLRWQLLAAVADGDRRVRELAARIDQPQNLVSYHVWLLRNAGLGRSCPSATPDPTLTGSEDSGKRKPSE
jgi:ArsR family transcriptional regulator, arsenate/arsenite/antimonite-responsive transcriptional repressor / arsenate reductase (thioredoxin)